MSSPQASQGSSTDSAPVNLTVVSSFDSRIDAPCEFRIVPENDDTLITARRDEKFIQALHTLLAGGSKKYNEKYQRTQKDAQTRNICEKSFARCVEEATDRVTARVNLLRALASNQVTSAEATSGRRLGKLKYLHHSKASAKDFLSSKEIPDADGPTPNVPKTTSSATSQGETTDTVALHAAFDRIEWESLQTMNTLMHSTAGEILRAPVLAADQEERGKFNEMAETINHYELNIDAFDPEGRFRYSEPSRRCEQSRSLDRSEIG